MAYEFKKLSEVLEVETANSTAKVLIEEEGIIKKVSKDELSGLKEVDWEIITNKPKIVTSWNNLEDKPFDAKIEMVEIVPEHSVTAYEQYEGICSYTLDEIFDFSVLEVGKTYIVVINGSTRKTTCISDASVVMGNGWLLWGGDYENTGEDFALINQGRGEYVLYWETVLGETITLAIYEEKEVVKQLDYKFMPAGYPKVETKMVEILPEQSVTVDDDGNFSITGDFTLTADKEYTVLFNGKTYVEKAKTASEPAEIAGAVWLGFNPFLGTDMDKPYLIMKHPVMEKMAGTMDATVLGKTITLAIYGEQEVVKPMDSRFVGGADMVIRVDGGPGAKITEDNAEIVSGNTGNVIEAMAQGRVPSIKIEYMSDEYAAEVNSVSVQKAYGERIYISFMVYNDGVIYGRRLGISGDEITNTYNVVFNCTG